MKSLIIITREINEYQTFWNIDNNIQTHSFTNDNQNIILIKKRANFEFNTQASYYAAQVVLQINQLVYDEVGIIFHSANDINTENILKNALPENIKKQIRFCNWYSSTKTTFWNESNGNADLPYNNLKRAWKDNNGDKTETFNKVWDFFLPDKELESQLNLLHACLVPTTVPTIEQFEMQYPVLGNFKGEYEEFHTAINNKAAFDQDYIDALKKMRVILLGA